MKSNGDHNPQALGPCEQVGRESQRLASGVGWSQQSHVLTAEIQRGDIKKELYNLKDTSKDVDIDELKKTIKELDVQQTHNTATMTKQNAEMSRIARQLDAVFEQMGGYD